MSEKKELSRRGFFKGAIAGAAALQGPTLIERAAPAAELRQPFGAAGLQVFCMPGEEGELNVSRVGP